MPRPSPTDLRRRIVDCVKHAMSVDVRPFELRSSEEIAAGLVSEVVASLERAIDLCRETLHAYDPKEEASSEHDGFGFDDESRPSSVFHIDVDALVRRADDERQVADVAFLGITELRRKLQRVACIAADSDRWEAVGECGSALRRVSKSLTALEAVLSRAEGLVPELSFSSQISRSLEVRRQYTRLRQVIAEARPDAHSLVRALRSAGTAIAVLIGKDVYPELRIHDRRQIRELQGRILAWLRVDSPDPSHVVEGQRLWQDLVGFADLIAHVSRRQELVEHDTATLARAYEAMRGDVGGVVDDRLRDLLETLTGLDPEIDARIAAGERAIAAWLPVIERLYEARSPRLDAAAAVPDDPAPGWLTRSSSS